MISHNSHSAIEHTRRLLFVLGLLMLLPAYLCSQSSKKAACLETISQSIERGTFQGFDCSQSITTSTSRSRSTTCMEVFNQGYGTNCWNDSNSNPDPACAIPAVSAPDCNGGRYRIPIAITIFECTNWNGANYLSIDGETTGGFEALTDTDLSNKLVEVNALYANANIEFYEVQRRRIEDCGLYDFFTGVDPATGTNELSATEAFDVPNAINVYFVGGINRDHDCCGLVGFASFPPSRDYVLLRYIAGVVGTNLAHELGHYFGLPHTYAASITGEVADTDGVPIGSLDNCDCLTTGDGICDTWPDPFLNHNCNHDGGTGGPCYINGSGTDFCSFDEQGYSEHISTSHPGVPNNLTISPNSGVDFSPTSSTILAQNIMTNHPFFDCTATFTPCQYRKIHDVARADCRNYLCNITTSDYFSSSSVNTPNSASYEICAGDSIPTFTAGNTVTRFDGSTYSLACFNWYAGEFDNLAQALLTNSSTYTPTAALLDNFAPGVYEFWVAEANAINEIPCKVKVSITVVEGAGIATIGGSNMAIDTCEVAALDIEAVGSTIDTATDIIGWYFSEGNPTLTLTTASAITTAITTATNSNQLDATTGNIIQSTSGSTLNRLEGLAVDCRALGDGNSTYYLTPFVAKGEESISCSVTENSIPVVWNFIGNLSNGAILNIGPFEECNGGGTLSDYSLTLNINDCLVIGGTVGVNINFNCGAEITFNSAFDLRFNCGTTTLTITKEQLEAIKADFDPLRDEICLSFVDAIFGPPNFEGDLTLTATARLEATYQNNTAQTIWNNNGTPLIDPVNPACFWGTPIAINCNCPASNCPNLGTIEGPTSLCLGSQNDSLRIRGITNIGMDSIQVVYFQEQQMGDAIYGTPDGILASISASELTNDSTEAILNHIAYPSEAGTYFIYAIVSPLPTEAACRPFLELPITINAIPAAPIVSDTSYCLNDMAVMLSAEGENLMWYDSAMGGTGSATAPIPNTAVVDTQFFYVTQTINNCESARASITVVKNTPPTVPIIRDTTYCQNDDIAPLSAIGENLRWYEMATGGTGSTTAPTPNTSIAGTQFYWVSQTVNNCESTRARTMVTIRPATTLSMTSFENPSTCGGSDGRITLNNLLASTRYTLAYQLSDSLAFQEFTSDDNGTYTLSNLSAGLYEAITVSDDFCTSQSIIQELSDPSGAAVMALEVIGNTTSLCVGDSIGIRATITGGENPYTIGLFDGATNRTIPDYNSGDTIQIIPTQTTIYTITSLMDANNCTNIVMTDSLTITVHPIPDTPITTDIVVCETAILEALTATGEALLWYNTAVGGVGLMQAPVPADTVGIQTYWVSQTINGCESERASLTVTINPSPELPIVTDTSYCQNEVAIPLRAEGENLLWYDLAQGGTGSTEAPTPNTSAVGTQTYWVSQTVNECESERARITVLIRAAIEARIASFENTSTCSGSDGSITLDGLLMSTSYTIAYQLNDSIRFQQLTTNDNGAVTIANLEAGVYQSIIVSNDFCASTSLQQEISDPGTATITSFQISEGNSSICEGDSIGVIITLEGGQSPYTIRFSEGTNTTTVEAYMSGTTLRLIPTQTTTYSILSVSDNGNCTNAAISDSLTISVQPIPDPPITRQLRLCQNTPDRTLTAEGQGLLWYESEQGGTGLSSPPRVSTSEVGTQTYWVSQTINGCESSRALLRVIVEAKSPPPTVRDRDFCRGDFIGLLIEGIPNALWYRSQRGGIGLSIQPLINSNNVGSTTYWISQTEDGCESDRSPLTVTIHPIPPAPTVQRQEYCVGEDVMPFVVSGVNLTWFTTPNGTGSNIPPTVSTAVAGVTQFWVTQTVNACQSSQTVLTVTVNDLPTPPTTTNISYCLNETATPLTAVGDNLSWYREATGGTAMTSITPTTTSIGTQTYWVSQRINDCESERAALTVTIQETAALPIVADTAYCIGATASPLSAIGSQLQWYTSAAGGTPSSTAPTPNTRIAGTTSYWVSQTINNCESERAMLRVTIHALPAAPTVSDTTYCIGDVAIPLTAIGGQLRWYSVATGGTPSSTAPTPTTTSEGIQSYWVSQTINGCESDRSFITITITEKLTLVLGNTANPTDNNANGSILLTGLVPNTSYLLVYKRDGIEVQMTITTNADGNYVLNNLLGGRYEIYVVFEGITSNTLTTTLESETNCTEKPSPPLIDPAIYCIGDTPRPLFAEGQNIRWYITPVGTIGTPNAPLPTTNLPGRYQFWVSQTINGCESERIPYIIQINEPPKPAIGLVIPPSECGKDGSIQLVGLEQNTQYYLQYDQNRFPKAKYIRASEAGTYTLRPLSAAVYEMTVAPLDGCTSAILEQEVMHPTDSFIATLGGATTICENTSATLTVDIKGGTAPYTIYFTDGIGHYAFQSYDGRGMTLRPRNTTTYTLIAIKDATHCYGTAMPNEVTVTVSSCTER